MDTAADTFPVVHIAVYEGFADWEVALPAAMLRGAGFQPGGAAQCEVRTVGETVEPVRSMGGLLVTPDLAVDALTPADSALLLIPGGTGWHEGDRHAVLPRTARAFVEAGVPVAAICDGTVGLAREGLLDDRAHTGADAGYLAAASGYRGGAHYRDGADAVRDRGVVTAGPTNPVAFTREIIAELGLWGPELLGAWFRLFGSSDAAAYPELLRMTTPAA